MHILANALPGFRDLRTPVVAGYLWLLFAWLLARPDTNRRPTDPLGVSLYQLGDHVGKLGIAIAVSLAAYFVGSVSQVVSGGLRATWTSLLFRLWLWLPVSVDRIIVVPREPQPPEYEQMSQLSERATTAIAASSADEDLIQERLDDINAVVSRAASEAQAELALPATLLVGKEPELFAEVDRLRAEGDFRLAAVPPLVALVILVAVSTGSRWYLAAVLAVLAILDQGVRRLNSSRQLVVDAKARGLVQSQALERLRSWTEAVESKPESPPPPPWQTRETGQRTLTQVERQRIQHLSTAPDELGPAAAILSDLSDDERHALGVYASDELRYVGTETPVGLAPHVHPGATELAQRGLITETRPDGRLWKLTDDGIAVARVLLNRRSPTEPVPPHRA